MSEDNKYTPREEARMNRMEDEAAERRKRIEAAYAGLTPEQRRAKVQEDIDMLFGR